SGFDQPVFTGQLCATRRVNHARMLWSSRHNISFQLKRSFNLNQCRELNHKGAKITKGSVPVMIFAPDDVNESGIPKTACI
ncbi:MAG TPA: hypothetical protein VHL11_16810, partial [Phototrophicaceae bacterium]|nr:hypothetical protein [Phototrophicaceae bacterium]